MESHFMWLISTDPFELSIGLVSGRESVSSEAYSNFPCSQINVSLFGSGLTLGGQKAIYKILKFGSNRLTLVGTLVSEFFEFEIMESRKFLSHLTFNEENFNQRRCGDSLMINFDSSSSHNFVEDVVFVSKKE
jgi:hypothetical protein